MSAAEVRVAGAGSRPSETWTQEIRFAVVFYGGVSLAIYMNGIAQEMLRLVRSTADLDEAELSGTELIYRKLGRILCHGRDDRRADADEAPDADVFSGPVRTRFVIDILSGTSAGGINAVALGKALALRLSSMQKLAETWRDDGHLDKLLNDREADRTDPKWRVEPRADGRTTSLLNSQRMLKLIYKTLSGMNEGSRDPDRFGFADEIDLFVTATDLNGQWLPIQLADRTIDEREHKEVFRFRYADAKRAEDLGLDRTDLRNDFTAKYDPMLAFAARCTSSFPVAFEPMTFDDLQCVLPKTGDAMRDAAAAFRSFFPTYQRPGRPGDENDFRKRPFADGGYLDNKPFSHALKLIQYRTAVLPTTRKLLFIDPFPEFAADGSRAEHKITFLENTRLAAIGLPRYETIRADIEAVNASNRWQERLEALRSRLDPESKIPEILPDDTLRRTVKAMGTAYEAYHHLRVAEVSDAIAVTVARVAGFNEESDHFLFVRAIVRVWRDAHFAADPAPQDRRQSENRFLHDFDMPFRLRRLAHVAQQINDQLKRTTQDDAQHRLTRARRDIGGEHGLLRAAAARLSSAQRCPEPLAAAVRTLGGMLQDQFDRFSKASDQESRIAIASDIYHRQPTTGAAINEVGEQLRQQISEAFAALAGMRAEHAKGWAEDTRTKIETIEQQFLRHDMISLPFFAGTGFREYTKTEVYRIGPAECELKPAFADRPDRKLAGTKYAAFGGFMSRQWRENDMMWGRLDAAERLVCALLPGQRDERLRKKYIKELHEQILKEELGADRNDRLCRWLVQRLRSAAPATKSQELLAAARAILDPATGEHALLPGAGKLIQDGNLLDFVRRYYDLPPEPEPDLLSRWLGRSLTIFGRMVDDDLVPEGRRRTAAGRVLRTLGITATKMVRFALPNTFWQRVARDWLGMLALAGAPFVLLGVILGQPALTSFGVGVIVAGILLVLVQQAVGVWLSGQGSLRKLARTSGFVLGALLLLLFGVGAWGVWSGVQEWAQRAHDSLPFHSSAPSTTGAGQAKR